MTVPAATLIPYSAKPTDTLAVVPESIIPAGEEHRLIVRATNLFAAEHMLRLQIGPDANVANSHERAFDLKVPANDARDFEAALDLPAGWRVFLRSSLTDAFRVSFTGRKRIVA